MTNLENTDVGISNFHHLQWYMKVIRNEETQAHINKNSSHRGLSIETGNSALYPGQSKLKAAVICRWQSRIGFL
jgi:hypothetical protein